MGALTQYIGTSSAYPMNTLREDFRKANGGHYWCQACGAITADGKIPSCASSSSLPSDAVCLEKVLWYMVNRNGACCVGHTPFTPLREFLERVCEITHFDTLALDLQSFEEHNADFLIASNFNQQMLSSDAGVRFQKALCSFLELGGVDLLLMGDKNNPYVGPLPANYDFGQGWISADEQNPKETLRNSLGAAIAVDEVGNFALLTFSGRYTGLGYTGSFYKLEEKPLYVEYCLLKSLSYRYVGLAIESSSE